MIRRVQFLRTFFVDGKPKYVRGEHYPLTDETRGQVLAGTAHLTTIKAGPIRLVTHAVEEALALRALRIARTETHKAEACHR